MTLLYRMASNRLASGADMLIETGADVTNTGKIRSTPMNIARGNTNMEVI